MRKASTPTEPVTDDGSYNFATNVLTPPSGWSATVPAGSNPLYVVSAVAEINGTTGTDSTLSWSTPVILASDGADGLGAALTNTSPIVLTDTLGFQYPTYEESGLTYIDGAQGTFQITEGGVDITTGNGVDYTVVGGAVSGSVHFLTKNGATFVINMTDGTYRVRVTGTPPESWTTTSETFTVRAVYGSVTFDRTYTISKIINNFSSVKIQTTNVTMTTYPTGGTSTAEFRLDNNGSEYEREDLGVPTGWTQVGSPGWRYSGNSSQYSVYATKISGTAYSGVFDSWMNLGTDRSWGVQDVVQDANHAVLVIKLQIRLDDSEVILTTRTVTLDAFNDYDPT